MTWTVAVRDRRRSGKDEPMGGAGGVIFGAGGVIVLPAGGNAFPDAGSFVQDAKLALPDGVPALPDGVPALPDEVPALPDGVPALPGRSFWLLHPTDPVPAGIAVFRDDTCCLLRPTVRVSHAVLILPCERNFKKVRNPSGAGTKDECSERHAVVPGAPSADV